MDERVKLSCENNNYPHPFNLIPTDYDFELNKIKIKNLFDKVSFCDVIVLRKLNCVIFLCKLLNINYNENFVSSIIVMPHHNKGRGNFDNNRGRNNDNRGGYSQRGNHQRQNKRPFDKISEKPVNKVVEPDNRQAPVQVWENQVPSTSSAPVRQMPTTSSAPVKQMPSTSNDVAYEKPSKVPRTAKPFNIRQEGAVESKKRLSDLQAMPYLERRGLTQLLSGNRRFHLMAFKGVPKFIKTSQFMIDMISNFAEIKERCFVSIHSSTNQTNDELVDYKIGFNSLKIVSRLRDVFGTGSINLYMTDVLVVYPDPKDMKMCEFNRIMDSEMANANEKNPWEISHENATLLDVVMMLEKVCAEKFWALSAICCNGRKTFINIIDSSILNNLHKYAGESSFSIKPGETAVFTGLIPSELLAPESSKETPINESRTGRMTKEEILKHSGFKALVDKHSEDTKHALFNRIKDSVTDCQKTLSNQMNEIESRSMNEIAKGFNRERYIRDQLEYHSERLNTIENNISLITNTVTKSFDLFSKYVDMRNYKITKKREGRPEKSPATVNSSTNERTVDYNEHMGQENNDTRGHNYQVTHAIEEEL